MAEAGDGSAAQPRPALGRRPWFALERRARSFLRFAFAMSESVPDGVPYRPGDPVAVCGGGWCFEPVRVAVTFRERRRGLRPRSEGSGLLLRTRSVHGYGMQEPLDLVFLDRDGAVVGARRLNPRRVMRCPSLWTLELPPGGRLPDVGTVLRVVPSCARCPEHSSSAARRSETSTT